MRAPDRVQNDLKKGLTEGVSTYVSRWKGPKGRRKIVGPKVARPDRLMADRSLEGRGAVLWRNAGVRAMHSAASPTDSSLSGYAASSMKRATSCGAI